MTQACTIWKAILNPADLQTIDVPIGSEFLFAREQFEQICVWYRCDPNAAKRPVKIAICGTGHTAPERENGKYLGTACLQGGALMFHVFQEMTP